MFSSFSLEENGREGDMLALLLLDREGKLLSRKSLKKPSTFPCSKRPRIDQTIDEAMAAGADNRESSSKKTGYDHLRCVSDEKCRIVKQKRGQDIKRIDRKSFKASVKTKFDSVTSKTAFISSDSASGGIDTIAVICGLKSELHDLTKHAEELSLEELLDGSCTYPNLLPEKGKKVSNGNENILSSVRKACSILPLHGAVDSIGNRKPLISLQNPSLPAANLSDRDEEDKCSKELSSKDSYQGKFSTSTLYQPTDFLEQLAFPSTMDLEAFTMNLNPSQCIMRMKAVNSSSLPPFPWSFSHGGTCKPGVDSCKFTLPRSAGQSKWFRIKNSFALSGGGNNCFSGIEGKTVNHNDEFANKQKIELLEEARSLIESIVPIFDGPQNISESHVLLDHSNSVIRSVVSGSLHSGKHEALDGLAETSGNHEEDYSKDCLFPQNFESEVGLSYLRNNLVDSQFDWPCKDSEIGQKEHPRRTTDDCSQSCNCYPYKIFTEGCDRGLWHSPTSELSKQGHSTHLLAAATILWEIASSSNGIKAQNDTGVRIKSPHSQKHIKDRKSTSVEKQERFFLASRHNETFKRSAAPSTRHRLISEKKTDFMHSNNLGRESEKWFLSGEVGDAPPRTLERDHLRTNHRLLRGNSMRPSCLMQSQSPIQVEKVCYESHLKLKKETLKASSIGFGDNYIKDWSRERSKRV